MKDNAKSKELLQQLIDINFNKIIGNLPYNISSQIIFKILNNNNWDIAVSSIENTTASRVVGLAIFNPVIEINLATVKVQNFGDVKTYHP